MANKNLELALRIRADLNNAIRQLEEFGKTLDGVSNQARKTDTGLTGLDNGARGAGSSLDATTGAANKTGRSLVTVEKDARKADTSLGKVDATARRAGTGLSTTSSRGGRASRTLRAVDANSRKAGRGLRKVYEDARSAGRGMDATTRSAGGLTDRIKGLVTVAAATLAFREIVRATDTLTNLQSQLRLVTDSEEELNTAFADTRDLANDTRQDLGSTIKLYARLARSTEELELAHGDLLTITRAINQSYIVSGASAQEAAASTLQLSQGIASGTLRGEELNSVLENSPRLARAIADGLGVTIGELRALGAEGQLTGRQITQALLQTADDIDREFHEMPRTVGQALQQLRNDFVVSFGETDTSGLVDGIDDLRELVNDPVFRENMVSLGTAVANSIGAAAEALNEFVELGRQAGEAAARIAGNADDIQDLESSIRRLESLQGSSGFSRSGFFTLLDGSVEFHLSEEEIDAELQAHRERLNELLIERGFAPRGSEAETEPVKTSARVENEIELGPEGVDGDRSAIQKRIAALEEQAALLGKSRVEVELYKLAQEGATESELAAARATLDRVAAYEKAQEALQQTAKDTQALADIENQLLNLQGRGAEARARELEQQYAGLLQRLEQRSDEAGIAIINRLINVEKAQAQLEQLQDEVDRIFSEQSRREQSIRAQQEAGLISELNARDQLLQLQEDTAAQVDSLIPRMEALAEATGNPKAIERVRDLRAQLERLRLTADEFTNTLQDSFEQGLADGLAELARGTQDLEETVKNVAASIADAMLELASQNLAKMATDALGDLVSSGTEAATETAAATASAATISAAITTSSTTGAAAMGSGITTAATTGGGAIATSMASAFASGTATLTAALNAAFATGAAQIAAASAGSAAGGFAEGGYTGPGTKYQVAGVVHAGEYVQPARVLREPGALGFMESFRREGMRALERFRGYAEGGLVSSSSINIDSPAASFAANVPPAQVHQRLLPVLDKDVIADALRGPEGEELVLVHITRNPGAFRQALGVNS